jgi:hypothetical protein
MLIKVTCSVRRILKLGMAEPPFEEDTDDDETMLSRNLTRSMMVLLVVAT